MGIFNIKLKTKNGNSVNKKMTFTVFFRIKYTKGLRDKAEYTYRIIYGSNKVCDNRTVLELKSPVKSMEDVILKVILNLSHIIRNISVAEDINPDFILYISPDLGTTKSKSWRFLSKCFKKPLEEGDDYEYNQSWDERECKLHNINKEDLDLLRTFVTLNPNTKFMDIDPQRDPKKYQKSIDVCEKLKDRLDRVLNIFD